MSSLIDLKTRSGSVSSTQKIIKAMELIATAKIKKARDKNDNAKFFYETTITSLKKLQNTKKYNEVIKSNPQGKDLYVLITSDMGLCGAYNSNVVKKFMTTVNPKNDYEIIVLGNKGVKKLEYANYKIEKSITNFSDKNEYELTKEITEILFKKYEVKELKSINIIYTDFINPILQEAKMVNVLEFSDLNNNEFANQQITIEPNEEEVLEELFKQYITSIVFTTLLKSFASEHSMRRNSMDVASKNSLELIEKLNLEINRERQKKVTQEITEIIGGSEASKKE